MYRIEKDTIGEMKVPKEKYWGIQTQRSLQNFNIGIEEVPKEIINAFGYLKKGAALAHLEMDNLDKEKGEAIVLACDEIIGGKLEGHFPLKVWQTGSGTQSHMNVNEVISFRANQILRDKGSDIQVHPNDDVNLSQSSNCNYPTAIHIAAVLIIENEVIPAMERLKATLLEKSQNFSDIIKAGRTHLQDAVPLTLGQEFSGWYKMIEKTESMIKESYDSIRELAFAGTAVGTGLNTFEGFDEIAVNIISELTGTKFKPAENKFHAMTSYDEIVFTHGALKALAADLMKIANDVRWLASGPRSGIGELVIPSNEPGSSMMPGKVNPTQPEAVTMVATQVIGNDVTIGMAASQGNFQVNVFKPVISYNFIQSSTLLADMMNSFNDNCIVGIEPNLEVIERNLNNSLMLVTVLNPYIGYYNAAEIAKKAHADGMTLKEAAMELKLLTEEEFDTIVDPRKMIRPNHS